MDTTNVIRALTQLEGRSVQVIAKSHNQDSSELNDHLCMVVGVLKYSEPKNQWLINNHNGFIHFTASDVTKIRISEADNSVIFIYWSPSLFGGPFLR